MWQFLKLWYLKIQTCVFVSIGCKPTKPNIRQKKLNFCCVHVSGLICILPVGSRLNISTFCRFRDRITNTTKVSVTGVNSNDIGDSNVDMHPRQFRVRYTYNHPLENNDWGDFQMHRSKYYKKSALRIGKLENAVYAKYA